MRISVIKTPRKNQLNKITMREGATELDKSESDQLFLAIHIYFKQAFFKKTNQIDIIQSYKVRYIFYSISALTSFNLCFSFISV